MTACAIVNVNAMETTDGASRKKKILTIVVVVGIVVLAGGAGVALRMLQDKDKEDDAAQQEEVAPPPDSVANVRDLIQSGDAEKAGQAVDDALKNSSLSDDEKYLLYIEQGRVASEKGDYQGAVDAFTKAWEIDETFDVARRLGSMQQQVGNNEKALEFYKKAMEINPKNSPTYEADNNVLKMMIDMLEGGQ